MNLSKTDLPIYQNENGVHFRGDSRESKASLQNLLKQKLLIHVEQVIEILRKTSWKSMFFFFWSSFIHYSRELLADRQTRYVFMFACLNLTFTAVEILFGIWRNSLSLLSDGLHMLFDSSALVFGLIVSIISKWPKNEKLSYGYIRLEVVGGFASACALTLAAISIIWKAFQRLLHPQPIHLDKLFLVAVLGLIINLIGVLAFSHHHSHHDDDHVCSVDDTISKGSGSSCDRHDDNTLFDGMFLHVLADTLGSIGVIISHFFITYFNWTWTDPICSIAISCLILISVWPLLKRCAIILLQCVPECLEVNWRLAMQKVMAIEGVLKMDDSHLWALSSDSFVATVKLQIDQHGNEQIIRTCIYEILAAINVRDVTVELNKI